MKTLRLTLLLCLGLASACSFDVTTPDGGDEALLRVVVTGGLVPAEFAYEIDTRGSVVGLECVTGCAFAAGDTLAHLTPAQTEALVEILGESGLPNAGRPADFGTECCDQFTYWVFYYSGVDVRSFRGGLTSFPSRLGRLVRMLDLLYRETPPVVIAGEAGLGRFSDDPLSVEDGRVVDGVLEVDVTYGGGCGVHDIDAVVHTDFTGAGPVQVGVALTHEDNGDICEALVTRTLRFDLEPLRETYSDAYGSDHGEIHLKVRSVDAILPYTF